MRRIAINEKVCIGCKLCEIHCVVKHSRSGNIIKAFKREKPRPIARVLVEERGASSLALQCRNCTEPPCIDACISGALYRDSVSGAVLHNADRCVGCWSCIMVCPFGAIKRDLSSKRIISKCDMCLDEDVPVCVANCPNEALSVVEL